MMYNSKRPVLLIGSQTMLNVTQVDNLAQKLASLNIPMFVSGMARGLLSKEELNIFRHQRKKALQEAGVFSIVLEMVTSEATKKITEMLFVPTIGIGCGQYCDGQVLVIHDMLGLFEKLKPKFVKRYLSLSEEIKKSISQYVKDVESGTFPSDEHSFHMEIQS